MSGAETAVVTQRPVALTVLRDYITLTKPVTPPEKGLPHFSDVHIWNIKATGAKQAFNVAAYPNATLDNFKIDHLNIEADTAGESSGTVRYVVGYACPASGTCRAPDDFRRRSSVAARFSFVVR